MSKRNVRYGAELRKRADSVDVLRRTLFVCGQCGKKKVKRSGNSLWECKGCGAVFAGGTYSLSTPSGDVAARLIKEYKERS
ncbi:MAG: 50S ribosomal protein L37ae [Candidatus Micrarchaeia archaeon]|jgi:large subunit ribosomal protein L37Ae